MSLLSSCTRASLASALVGLNRARSLFEAGLPCLASPSSSVVISSSRTVWQGQGAKHATDGCAVGSLSDRCSPAGNFCDSWGSGNVSIRSQDVGADRLGLCLHRDRDMHHEVKVKVWADI